MDWISIVIWVLIAILIVSIVSGLVRATCTSTQETYISEGGAKQYLDRGIDGYIFIRHSENKGRLYQKPIHSVEELEEELRTSTGTYQLIHYSESSRMK